MSNIPDYVGGILSVAMYGRPLLKDDKPAHLEYNVLLNPPKLKNREHFRAEYMLMYDDKRVTDHFALRQPPATVARMMTMMTTWHPWVRQ